MKTTIRFRLQPTISQEALLNEIFTVYNRVKRKGYKLICRLKDTDLNKNEKRKIIQPQLMALCQNNPYVNSILIDCETKLAQQETWFGKQERFLTKQVKVIEKKIDWIKEKDKKDRRLKGLYSRLSSAQNKLLTLRFKPLVFGTKRLFRERILRKITREEFRISRDSSFCCVGKKQGVNLNLKVLPDMTLKIRTFSKEKGKKWLIIPFMVNYTQKKWFNEIVNSCISKLCNSSKKSGI